MSVAVYPGSLDNMDLGPSDIILRTDMVVDQIA